MPRILLALPGLLLAATAAFGADDPVQFESMRQIKTRDYPVDRVGLGDNTLVRTGKALLLVDWSRPGTERDSVLITTPLATSYDRLEFVAWGDSVVALAPEGQAPHLVVHLGPDGLPVIETVDDPDWLPPNCWLGGLPYLGRTSRTEVELQPALGGTHDAITIPTEYEIWPTRTVFAGDRCVGVSENHENRDVGAFQVWDLSDPQSPRRGPVFTTPWLATDVLVDGHIMYLGAGTLQTWDISDVDEPLLLDELGPASHYLRMAMQPGRHLAAWLDESYIRVADISDPADLRVYKSFIPGEFPPYYMAPLSVEDRRLVVSDPDGLRALDFPTGSSGNITDEGLAWPAWGALKATDGVRVWIQGTERYLADMAAETMVRVAEPTLPQPPPAGSYRGFLAYHHGHLLYGPGDGRFVVEDVSDPAQAEVVHTFPETATFEDHALGGDLLALRSGQTVILFDVSNPATPVMHGLATVAPCDQTYMAMADGLLVVGHSWDYVDRFEVRIYGTSVTGEYPEIGGFEIIRGYAPDWKLNVLDSELYIHRIVSRTWIQDWRCDLSDPGTATAVEVEGIHLWEDELPMFPLELSGAINLVRVQDHTLLLELYEGHLPPAGPSLAEIAVPYGVSVFAVANDRVFLSDYWDILSYRVTGLGISDAGPPAPPNDVAIAPNPFNARTEIAFAMGRNGVARADIYDLRGRHLRALEAEFPSGPATLTWNGRDAAGRDLPSGVYLVRVTRPTGMIQTRCTLVR